MIKRFIRRLLLREKASSKSYVAYLRKKGALVGDNVRFFAPRETHVDVTFPWLLTIGDYVSIARGVTILTHDYAWSVVKRHPAHSGQILGAMGPVTIGNNVFIGMNALITRGVTIGDNVIIGAGSVVTSNCESDSVYAGNPARKLMSVSQFREKRSKMQFEEARQLALSYRRRFNTEPPREVFWEYFMLFCTAEEAKAVPAFHRQMATGANFEDTVAFMEAHEPAFAGYEAFLNACWSVEEREAT